MFQALLPLVASGGKITLTIAATSNGQMKVIVCPENKNGSVPALSQPLALVATPEELDAEFVDVISNYVGTRNSLLEQVEATNALLKNAEKSQAGKAVKSLKGSAASTKVAAAPGGDDDDEETSDENEGGGGGDDDIPADTKSDSPVVVSGGTDLSSLL